MGSHRQPPFRALCVRRYHASRHLPEMRPARAMRLGLQAAQKRIALDYHAENPGGDRRDQSHVLSGVCAACIGGNLCGIGTGR
jgi:hypothetical protein